MGEAGHAILGAGQRRHPGRWRSVRDSIAAAVGAAMIALPLVVLSMAPGLAQMTPGDPLQGHQLASELCKTCHLVDAGDRGVFLDGSPSLQDVADAPDTTELGLRVFFQTPHGSMPDLILSDAEVDDLIAYILSLK
jgi:mono/diheme cytochrome c family protein